MLAEKIEQYGAKKVLEEIQEKCERKLVRDGHNQTLRKRSTLYEAVSMKKLKGRLTIQSDDLSDLIQLWVEQQKMSDPFLRYVALSLSAIMFTEKDLQTIHEMKTVTHIWMVWDRYFRNQ